MGGENELSNLDITEQVLSLMGFGHEMIEYVEDRKGHDLRYAMNIEKAKQELGWYPRIDFKTGLTLTVNWYKENEKWWRNLRK